MKIKFLSLFLLAFCLQSCNEKKVFDELDKDFPENRWLKGVTKNFEFSIEQEARNYDVNVHFAYFSDFVINPVPLFVTIIYPDGTEEKTTLNLVVKDSEGKETGECGGDYCDIREIIFKNEALKKGVYKIAIQQQFDGAYLPNVNGIGIEVVAQAD
ncbi:hypothetical protein [Flavobacterium sp.]|jgi:gliding motility-associated lipoprotein GldH|uniref:hypothetical protein n=1 Tax=Flavobacterium sp. TaxID=239 RepID=UPI0037C084D0